MTITYTATTCELNGKPVEADPKAFALMLKRKLNLVKG